MKKRFHLICMLLSMLLLLSVSAPVAFADDRDDGDEIGQYLVLLTGDYEAAIEGLTQLSESGSAFATELLAWSSLNNIGFALAFQDSGQSFDGLADRLAEVQQDDNPFAGGLLASFYRYGIGTDASEEKADLYGAAFSDWLCELAETAETPDDEGMTLVFAQKADRIDTGLSVQNPIVCQLIGRCYHNGATGFEQNTEKAAAWIREAVRYGLPDALAYYTDMMMNGEVEGTIFDLRIFLEPIGLRYRSSANAVYCLAGLEFHQGNVEAGQKYLKNAAELGNERARSSSSLSDSPLLMDYTLIEGFERLEQSPGSSRVVGVRIPTERELPDSSIPEAVLEARDIAAHVYLLFYDNTNSVIAYSSSTGCIGAGMNGMVREIADVLGTTSDYVLCQYSCVDPSLAGFSFDHYSLKVIVDNIVYDVDRFGAIPTLSQDLGILILSDTIKERNGFLLTEKDSVQIGDMVYALGYPNSEDAGLQLLCRSEAEEVTVLSGSVLEIKEGDDGVQYVYISDENGINMSGCPLVDKEGNLVGICITRSNDSGISNAIYADDIEEILIAGGLTNARSGAPSEE
ncbi:MAG: trypsin-like peptidase domain-containing protein [Oscillospiraceae bacterium]|nr:trypsin-like peptidase domain-containing protein [Oscillospiraceae bacterium]